MVFSLSLGGLRWVQDCTGPRLEDVLRDLSNRVNNYHTFPCLGTHTRMYMCHHRWAMAHISRSGDNFKEPAVSTHYEGLEDGAQAASLRISAFTCGDTHFSTVISPWSWPVFCSLHEKRKQLCESYSTETWLSGRISAKGSTFLSVVVDQVTVVMTRGKVCF